MIPWIEQEEHGVAFGIGINLAGVQERDDQARRQASFQNEVILDAPKCFSVRGRDF